jgi:hypothetical protein
MLQRKEKQKRVRERGILILGFPVLKKQIVLVSSLFSTGSNSFLASPMVYVNFGKNINN